MTVLSFALDPYIKDWLDLLIRWLHVIAAISWIGASFYFVLLDQSLREPDDPKDVEDGVRGELWEVHGGGFYHVKKYQVVPNELPSHLAWFKWEAYTTWLSGFALFVVLYWLDAKAYMIDASVRDMSPGAAVGISAALLVAAWVVYDIACRLFTKQPRVLAAVIAGEVIATAWVSGELFSPRAAWLQAGAMIGTIMAANVFFNIIPAHWELIRAKKAGRDPDPTPGIQAKNRSVHNNYFTLPVLITMLAGHFTFLTGRDHSWLILLALMLVGAWIRHFYNLRHQGSTRWWMPIAGVLGVLALAISLAPESTSSAQDDASSSEIAAGKAIFEQQSCGGCHTLADANASGNVAPNLDTADPDVGRVTDRVTNGVGGMPAFKDTLTEEEIRNVAQYVVHAAAEN